MCRPNDEYRIVIEYGPRGEKPEDWYDIEFDSAVPVPDVGEIVRIRPDNEGRYSKVVDLRVLSRQWYYQSRKQALAYEGACCVVSLKCERVELEVKG